MRGGPDQSDPCPVDAKAGNFADGESQIRPGEDRAGGCFHRVAANHASRRKKRRDGGRKSQRDDDAQNREGQQLDTRSLRSQGCALLGRLPMALARLSVRVADPLACRHFRWRANRAPASWRGFKIAQIPRPEHQHAAEPRRHQHHESEQRAEADEKPIVVRDGLDPSHRPRRQPGKLAGERASVEQQVLLLGHGSAGNRPFIPRSLIIHGFDVVALSRGQVGLGTGSRIGRECVGQRSGVFLPDAALDAVLSGQRLVDGGRQIKMELWIGKGRG
jgi:hypothetical protein